MAKAKVTKPGGARRAAARPAEPPPAPSLDPRRQRLLLGATILASALGFIDANVVAIALPTIQADLDAGFAAMQWVVNGYGLMLGALILIAGGLGDRLGRRSVFLVGIGIFTAGSLCCALAPSIGILIAARVLQGIGAALLVPQSLAIITATFPREVRGRAIGTWAAASSVTTALGPPLGGFLVDLLSWRAAFWINIPLAAIAIWLTLVSIPESRDPNAKGPLDWTGAIVAVLSFGALTLGLTGFSGGTDVAAWAYVALAGGIVGLGLFIFIEANALNPVMPLTLFRSRAFTGANIATVFLYGALSGLLFLMPFDLIARRGLSAAEAGFTLMTIGIIIGVASRYTGSLSDRIGPRWFLIAGSAIVALGAAGLALGLASYWFGVLVPILFVGIGMAIVVSPLTTAVMNAAEAGKSGAASGVNNAASRLAGLVAIATFGAVSSLVYIVRSGGEGLRFGVLPPAGDPARAVLEPAFITAYSTGQWLAAAWAALATLSVIFFIRNETAPAPSRPPAGRSPNRRSPGA